MSPHVTETNLQTEETDIHPQDYRFLDYRITQLENKLDKGLNKLEHEQREYNLQVMNTLHQLQEGQQKTYENIAQIQQRQSDMEDKLRCIDKLREVTNRNSERIQNNNTATNHRIDVVQKILFAVGGAAVSALFAAAFSIVQILILQT